MILHVAHIEEKMNLYRIMVVKPEGNSWESLDVGGRIILKLILERQTGVILPGFIWLRIGTSGVLL
jgi:hypothetical protein